MRASPNLRIEKWRVSGPLNSAVGAFVWRRGGVELRVIAGDGGGWDHVSVSMALRVPTWDEMCWVKAQFFRDDEVVMQLHPAKQDYINECTTCLHLWRPQTAEEIARTKAEWGDEWPYGDLPVQGVIPLPPREFVGLGTRKTGGL